MLGRTRIIIYGLRTEADAEAVSRAGADAAGFFLVPGGEHSVEPEEAWAVAQALGPLVSTIGVHVNVGVDDFCEIEERFPADYSQLHGEEPEAVVRQCGPRVIKSVRFDPATIARELARWGAVEEVDAVMVRVEGKADSGVWEAIRAAAENAGVPLILGGGLTAANVGEAIRIVRPWAVGVMGAVMAGAGIDAGRVAEFCSSVREGDRAV